MCEIALRTKAPSDLSPSAEILPPQVTAVSMAVPTGDGACADYVWIEGTVAGPPEQELIVTVAGFGRAASTGLATTAGNRMAFAIVDVPRDAPRYGILEVRALKGASVSKDVTVVVVKPSVVWSEPASIGVGVAVGLALAVILIVARRAWNPGSGAIPR